MCSCLMVCTSQQGDRWWLELKVDSTTMSKTCAGAELIVVLIKAQLSALNVATERGTSDKTEATCFSQCAYDQWKRQEAEDCDSIRPINFRWEETYTPTALPRSRLPHNVLHSPSRSKQHTQLAGSRPCNNNAYLVRWRLFPLLDLVH